MLRHCNKKSQYHNRKASLYAYYWLLVDDSILRRNF